MGRVKEGAGLSPRANGRDAWPVVSHYEVRPLLSAREAGQVEVEASPDLGRSRVVVRLSEEGVHYPGEVVLRWEDAAEICRHENVCFRVTPDGVERLQVFSPLTGRVCALYPTGTAPTLTLSGIPMHRIQGTDPWRDTLAKVRAARPRGRVLDTCMGLGYTAIAAARTAEYVLTVELDPAVLVLARANPWSAELFVRPNVGIVQADVGEFIAALPDASFSVVIHDPPMFSLAGELYSLAFYKEVFRVLRPRGRLFHYVGSPESKMGRNVTRSVMQRLREAGFRVRPARAAFGVVATR